MTDNTAEAMKKYKAALKKINLEEGRTYECDFEFGKEKITFIKPLIVIDSYETSPTLVFELVTKTSHFGTISFSDPALTFDRYDKAAIKEDFKLENFSTFNIKLLKKEIIDNFNIKL